MNIGRQRRPSTVLDQISRTLEDLEARLDRARESRAGEPHGSERRAAPADRASFEKLAREIDQTRRREDDFAAVESIAGELKALREDVRHMMAAGLRPEFETLRKDMARLADSMPSDASNAHLVQEFDRLSHAIAQLAERGDDRAVQMLRLELEQVKSALGKLASEETVRSVSARWEAFDERWGDLEHRVAAEVRRETDPAIEALHARLEQIDEAVRSLPDSLSLREFDDKLRMLAATVEQVIAHRQSLAPETIEQIDTRLDEISRAIAASASAAQAARFDPEPFERIEARIASLARQVEELVEDRPAVELMERLKTLSQRIDQVASQAELPQHAVERLAEQIAAVAERLDAAETGARTEAMLGAFEARFARVLEALERRQDDAVEQSRSLFGELERRLDDLAAQLRDRPEPAEEGALMMAIDERFAALAQRFDARTSGAGDAEAVRALEARLEDIARRLQMSAEQAAGLDRDIVGNLQSQIATLSEHLSRPGPALPEFDDLGPRLDHIERSITQSRESVVEAARRAAEEAIRSMGEAPADPAAHGALSQELKALEALTRRSDERNARTFEAIHDTLLKVVDRLGSLEGGGPAPAAAQPAPREEAPEGGKIAVETPPPMLPQIEDDLFEPHAGAPAATLDAPAGEAPAEEPQSREATPGRSPAEAAAAAAQAAMDTEEPGEGRRSMLGGLTRALAARRGRAAEPPRRTEPALEERAAAAPAEQAAPNAPIEPGTGGPDLNAIMRRVREQRGQPSQASGSEAAKSDFIAAARRAAQAAAAEAEITKKKQSDPRGSTSRFALGQLLGRNKKPVLIAGVALLVGLAGLQAGKALMGGEEVVAQNAVAPVETPAVAAVADPQSAEPPAADAAARAAAAPDGDAPARNFVARIVDNGDARPLDTAAAPAGAEQAGPTRAAAAADTTAADDDGDGEPAGEAMADDAPAAAARPAGTAAEPAEAETAPAFAAIPAEAGPVALREAAASGDARAMFEIGSRYGEGRGVEADLAQAAEWYARAAELGLAPAQYRIGNFYEKGMGVERDIGRAKMWYQLAAEQGNASAMHNLGVLHAMGADGVADNESAARWFLRAAELGVKDSQFNLGILTAKGVGMQQDLEEAYKWFALVAETGDGDAAAKRDEIAGTLEPERLERARAKAELWKPRELDRATNMVDVPEEWTESETTTAAIEPAGVDMRKAVGNIQLILNNNGYDAGPVDGVMGDKTRAAIKAFQSDNGMPADGEVDETLVRALLERK
uniref:peptidoglycan-binding protein n=1 Tax=Aquibium sp. A9E412 TaxID=2976767 RepID=UPI00339D78B3